MYRLLKNEVVLVASGLYELSCARLRDEITVTYVVSNCVYGL